MNSDPTSQKNCEFGFGLKKSVNPDPAFQKKNAVLDRRSELHKKDSIKTLSHLSHNINGYVGTHSSIIVEKIKLRWEVQ